MITAVAESTFPVHDRIAAATKKDHEGLAAAYAGGRTLVIGACDDGR